MDAGRDLTPARDGIALPDGYPEWLGALKRRLRDAQLRAHRIVNQIKNRPLERVPTSHLTIENVRNAARIASVHIAAAVVNHPKTVEDRMHRHPIA